MKCPYIETGCAHVDGCLKRFSERMYTCGYFEYFKFLDKFVYEKYKKP
jgi:hypothetical protein